MVAQRRTFNVACLLGRAYLTNTRRSPNVGTVLAHRLRRCPNIIAALGEYILFRGDLTNSDTSFQVNE